MKGMNLTNITGDPNLTGLIYFNSVFRAVITILICFGNILVIVAVLRSSILKTVPNHFIMHLAIADLCVGITIPSYIASSIWPALVSNTYVCIFKYCSVGVTAMASVLCLLSITVDRYIAIVYPLRYKVIMTLERARRMTVIIWVLSVGLFLGIPCLWHNQWTEIPDRDCLYVKIMKWEYLGGITTPSFVLATVFIIGLYGKIFWIAHQRGKGVTLGETHLSQKSLKVDLKIAKMAAIVLGIFVACWFPFVVVIAVQIYGDLVYSEVLNDFNRFVGTNMLFVNSAVNPVIYAFCSDAFKKEFKKLLHIKTKPRNVPTDAITNSTYIEQSMRQK